MSAGWINADCTAMHKRCTIWRPAVASGRCHASRDSAGGRLALLAAAGETLENAPLFRAPGAANTN
jgi:hypothetical protein